MGINRNGDLPGDKPVLPAADTTASAGYRWPDKLPPDGDSPAAEAGSRSAGYSAIILSIILKQRCGSFRANQHTVSGAVKVPKPDHQHAHGPGDTALGHHGIPGSTGFPITLGSVIGFLCEIVAGRQCCPAYRVINAASLTPADGPARRAVQNSVIRSGRRMPVCGDRIEVCQLLRGHFTRRLGQRQSRSAFPAIRETGQTGN